MAPEPSEIDALRTALAAAEARAAAAEAQAAEAARERAVLANAEAMIAALRLEIEKLRRALYGARSERKARLLEQLELQLEELEATATEDDLAAEALGAPVAATPPRERRRRGAQALPGAPAARARGRAGADLLRGLRLGADRQARRGRHRDARGDPAPLEGGPDRAREVHLPGLRADQPAAGAVPPDAAGLGRAEPAGDDPLREVRPAPAAEPPGRALRPRRRRAQPLDARRPGRRLRRGARAPARPDRRACARAQRLHGDDTPVPVLAKGKTDTGRLWVYVRDDRPFAGGAPPAALYRYSRDRRGEHPAAHLAGWSGILQADAYAGFGSLYAPDRSPAPVTEALCWAHARRKFFELADIAASARRGSQAPPISPLAREAVTRIDAIFDAERAINGLDAGARLAIRQEQIAPLVAELETWMRRERARLSRHAPVAKAMDYMLKRWNGFARFLADGRVCLTNNAAERALRGIALGRKAWLFAGSDRGGERAAFMYGLITTAKLNDIDPQAWLADVLGSIAGTPVSRLDELLPWNWNPAHASKAA